MSGWNNEALQGVFRHSLNDSIKDELASREESPDLDQLISLAIRVDNRLCERRRERVNRPQPFDPVPSVATYHTPTPSGSDSRRLSPGRSESKPMQLGRARLTPEEWLRRMSSGACLYCGQVGHLLDKCPVRPVKASAHQ